MAETGRPGQITLIPVQPKSLKPQLPKPSKPQKNSSTAISTKANNHSKIIKTTKATQNKVSKALLQSDRLWTVGQARGWGVECSEKHKSFKLKIPQPDSERCHSPDFRIVFGIMIGPFSSCEIGKT